MRPYLRWFARRGWERLGLPGIAGIVLLIVAGAYGTWVVRPLAARVEVLQARQTPPSALAPPVSVPTAVRSRETVAQILARLHEAARLKGLALEQASYQAQREAELPVVRYRLTLPVKGDYPTLRAFIAGVLREVPHAALESVEFRRDASASPVLTAQVKLVLWLESAP
ncbi:MAG: hypothetical protein WHV61_03995 [Burkholderiales bacterium]